MPRLKPTTELIAAILARVPEGFISQSALAQRVEINNKLAAELVQAGVVERIGDDFYAPDRLTPEQLNDYRTWCRPILPNMNKRGELSEPTITEQQTARKSIVVQMQNDFYVRILQRVEGSDKGYIPFDDVCESPEERAVLQHMLTSGLLKHSESLVYDPLRIGPKTIRLANRQYRLAPMREQLIAHLQGSPGATASRQSLITQFDYDASVLNEVMSSGGFSSYHVPVKKASTTSELWIRLAGSNVETAMQAALAAVKINDETWQPALEICGDVLRPGSRDGKRRRTQVIARTFIVTMAAKRLHLKPETLEAAIGQGALTSFVDPEERVRIPAVVVESLRSDPPGFEALAAFETIRAREISLVCGVIYQTARRRLQRARLSTSTPTWGEVRGRWELPETYAEFRQKLKQRLEQRREERAARIALMLEQEKIRREQERLDAVKEKQRRDELRIKLVEAFPTWRHDGRVDQRILAHVGPPNSGKTYVALNALVEAGSGWYLAPLRLLAFEIFDRLNQQGVPCNLLTGEEYVEIPGARFTAATIEMFDARSSGECVVIDEAHMLADPDRGWAWTRALMTAKAPEIHVIGPDRAQSLIERLSASAAIPLEIVGHQRLAPIKIADKHWPLRELPRRTILVAFSRWMVLHLKTDLEQMDRRVSVVYGNLPPEVRRKQADRFASGETEICVATDAVGMGLNLPADYVCFYEIEKFDGRQVRNLTADEIQQIGGRAGRFGLSTIGEIGATNKHNLNYIRRQYYAEPHILTHARVAPSVEDLELIPGNLASKLAQWSSLQSIPESLRNAIKTADMTERIELAKMLEDREVDHLGLDLALKLVNAPTRQSSRPYWLSCVRAILRNSAMPLPEDAPSLIVDSDDLERTEYSISCADIYLWLARRPEFRFFAPDEQVMRQMRLDWSTRIDRALVLKLDTSRRCTQCKRPLPLGYRYRICDRCYNRRYDSYDDV